MGNIRASDTANSTFTYDFHLSKNDFTCFPIGIWKRLLNHTLRDHYDELLFYGDPQGEDGLHHELATYLLRFRGVVCRKEQIVIGAEQHLLMNYLALMLRNCASGLAVENPCYPLIHAAFQSHGYEVFHVTEPDGGISISGLQDTGARIAAVAPSHQYPSGRVIPFNERMALLEWAKENEAYIVEDDYGGELRYPGQPVPALQGIDPSANVIYIGGFSQILAPDLCIHYMVLPNNLIESFHEIRRTFVFEQSSSRIYQRTLQRFMEQGHFEKHVRKMRNLYRRKNHMLSDALETHFRDVGEVMNVEAGLHVILKLQASPSEQEMVEAVRPYGIRIAAASPFYASGGALSQERRFIIGFGGIASERIDEGIHLLRKLWKPYLGA